MAATLHWLYSLVSGRILKTIFKVPPSPVLLAAETGACWQNIPLLILTQRIHRIMTQDGPLGVLLPLQNFNIFSSGFFKNHQQQSMLNAQIVILDKFCCNFFSMQWTWKWRCLKTAMCPSPIFRSMQHVDRRPHHLACSDILYCLWKYNFRIFMVGKLSQYNSSVWILHFIELTFRKLQHLHLPCQCKY